jgi:S-DNA-T family DNA segregation ATPase FtsK/SpoIIIE
MASFIPVELAEQDRIQGAHVSEREIEAVTKRRAKKQLSPRYRDDVTQVAQSNQEYR